MPMALAIASAVGTVVSTVRQRNAANAAADDASAAAQSAAATTEATAAYNARVATADAEQIALDSSANVRAMRQDAAVYLSRQQAAFAGSGVRADTGSPLAVRVASAGRLALREQQAHAQATARIDRISGEAAAGIAQAGSRAEALRIEGQSRADSYHREGTAAVLNGATRLIGQGAGAYNAGYFGSSTKVGLTAATGD